MITHTIESYWIPSQKMTASWLPIPLSHIGSQVKRWQSQSYKFKKFAKISILKWALHATHLLKLLDKMCKYEMDPMSIVEDTEWTRFCPQTDRRTRWYHYTPYKLRWSGGYNNLKIYWLVSFLTCMVKEGFHKQFNERFVEIISWISLKHSQMCQKFIDGSAQDCRNSIADALDLSQSCTKLCPCIHW